LRPCHKPGCWRLLDSAAPSHLRQLRTVNQTGTVSLSSESWCELWMVIFSPCVWPLLRTMPKTGHPIYFESSWIGSKRILPPERDWIDYERYSTMGRKTKWTNNNDEDLIGQTSMQPIKSEEEQNPTLRLSQLRIGRLVYDKECIQ